MTLRVPLRRVTGWLEAEGLGGSRGFWFFYPPSTVKQAPSLGSEDPETTGGFPVPKILFTGSTTRCLRGERNFSLSLIASRNSPQHSPHIEQSKNTLVTTMLTFALIGSAQLQLRRKLQVSPEPAQLLGAPLPSGPRVLRGNRKVRDHPGALRISPFSQPGGRGTGLRGLVRGDTGEELLLVFWPE